MTDNQCLAICAAILTGKLPTECEGDCPDPVRVAAEIGEFFGVNPSEKTQMELLLGQPTQTALPEFIADMKARL